MASPVGGSRATLPGVDGPPKPGVSADRQAPSQVDNLFNRFNFHLSSRPSDPGPMDPHRILPWACLPDVISWEGEEHIHFRNPLQAGALLTLYLSQKAAIIEWAHASPLHTLTHPGALRTLYRARQRFWWPSMAADVQEFVATCPTSACSKGSNMPPHGILQPLPKPRRPWSHISLEFVTGLPLSDGNTLILTVVDRFSKMVHFIPVNKLSSAKETAELMFHHPSDCMVSQ